MGKLLFGPACAALALFYFTILNQCLIESTASSTLNCNKPNFRVRYERTGCDNNTCATALAAGRRACAAYKHKKTWCDCKPGFFRNLKNNCVSKEQCLIEKYGQPCHPGQLKCFKPNEEIKCYHQAPPCYQTTCESLFRPRIFCKLKWPPKIEPHCGCKPGYFYNKAGNCVTRGQCEVELKCDKPNFQIRYERTGCDNNTCATALTTGPRACAMYVRKTTWCDCKPGFFRNSKGDCVTRQQCAAQCDKPNFQIRYERTGCDNNTCVTALSGPRPCAKFIQKTKWCDCKPGFFRNSKGDCVTRTQCLIEKHGVPCDPGKLKCVKPNEEIKCYHEDPFCTHTRCANLIRPYIYCNLALLPLKIEPHCGCKPGYFYNKAGNCISRKQCEAEFKCDKPNFRIRYERTGCDNNTCATALATGRRVCAFHTIKMIWCDCKPGFFRNSKDDCVTRQQCTVQ